MKRKHELRKHTPVSNFRKPEAGSSRIAKSRAHAKKIHFYSKRTVLYIIAFTMLIVAAITIFTLIATPERVITSRIASLTEDYYENYFYDRIGEFNNSDASFEEIMHDYAVHGFAPLSLNQLTHFDNGRHLDASGSLSTYCNMERSSVQIFPFAPYGRTDYDVKYSYSCNF